MGLKLVQLTNEYKIQLFDMMDEWSLYNNTHHTNHSPWAIFKNDYHDFNAYLKDLDFKENDEGHVPTTTLFLLDEERNIFLGAVNIRHHLNYSLYIDGGHIGDGIRPSERRKGYATKMIGLALEECKKIGLRRVLLVCNKNNIGSKKSIINNGGILENEIETKDGIEQRYWIELYPYNELVGKNIILRKAIMSDLEQMLKNIWSDERVYKTMWFKPTFEIEDGNQRLCRSIDYQAYNDAYFVALKDTNEPIGLCAIKQEAIGTWEESGICIAFEHQSKGYGTEVLKLLLDLAFCKYKANMFIYALMKDNDKSRSLKNHFNFKLMKESKEIRPWDQKEFDLEYYYLSKEDYFNEE